MNKVLIVDDEAKIRKIIKLLLQSEGYEVVDVESGEEAVLVCKRESFDLALLDLNMNGMDGISTMEHLRTIQDRLQFIFVTAHGTVRDAVSAIQKGAYNFVQKPFDNDELLGLIKGALEVKTLYDKVAMLESQISEENAFSGIIGTHESMQKVFKMAERVAPSDMTVLVTGESGTGKELIVRSIHRLSQRKTKTFVPVNCAAIPPNLFESEFFGHQKGAFTGAITNQKGKFREANNGTLFLDEIGELPLEFQAKLLRVLEQGEVTPVGASIPFQVDVRIIAATNKNLKKEVEKGNFREDLFYRLNVLNIQLPPLKDRKSDIILIAMNFVKNINPKLSLSKDAIKALKNYESKGNIRELRNEIQRATILADDQILAEHFSFTCEKFVNTNINNIIVKDGIDLELKLDEIRNTYIKAAMKETNDNKTKAAKLLNMSYRSFSYQLEKLEK